MATNQNLELRRLVVATEDVDTGSARAEEDKETLRREKETSKRGRAWETGVARRFPWDAGAACLLAILCTAACAGVLAAANDTPVSQWHVAPSVILAILAAVVNGSLAYALAEAVNYRWWIQAVEGRATLNDLNRVWTFGTSVGCALMAGRHINLVALASVAVTILAIDGPLLQRAISSVVKDISVGPLPVNATLADQIPLGYSGLELLGASSGSLLSSSLVTEQFQEVVQQYQQRQPIIAHSISGCPGICSGHLEGAGLHVDCATTITDKAWYVEHSRNESFAGLGPNLLVPSPGEIFSVSFAWSGARNLSESQEPQGLRPLLPVADGRPPDEPFILMNLTWSPNGTIPEDVEKFDDLNYTTSIHQKQCRLYPGSARYPVTIRNDSATLAATAQPAVTNTIELRGNSTFLPGSYQNTAKLIIDGLNAMENNYRFPNLSNLALPKPLDRLPKSDPSEKVLFGSTFQQYGTLSGLAAFLQNSFGSRAYVREGASEIVISISEPGTEPLPQESSTYMVAETSGPLVSQFLRKDSPSLNQGSLRMPSLLFNDPTSFLLLVVDELMFRIAVQTAFNNTFGVDLKIAELSSYESVFSDLSTENLTSTKNSTGYSFSMLNNTRFPASRIVDMDVVQSVQVYKASYPFLGGAIAVILLAVFLVVPLFYGFWRLGRRTGLSPLETATALGAPLLATVVSSSNGTASEIMRTAGMQRVRYGECYTSEPNTSLVDDKSRIRLRRLQFGQANQVGRPTSGVIYS